MIVDDEPLNIRVVQRYLKDAGYSRFTTTSDSKTAFDQICRESPDVLLLDIMMPDVDGLSILESVRATPELQFLPVLILTASTDDETKTRALSLGATDFLNKPIRPTDLLPRVRNALLMKSHMNQLKLYSAQLEQMVAARTEQLERSRAELIQVLACAAEYRDQETGNHVLRVGEYSACIATHLGLSAENIELIRQAAVLHDVGKIGIPDAILLKPAGLTPEERVAMQKHCEYGTSILEARPCSREMMNDVRFQSKKECESPVLLIAAKIAQTHHERWDGAGYPMGLRGEGIPLEGRITCVADVFDALFSDRPYKKGFPLEKCLDIIREGSGSHFDPTVVEAFFRGLDDIVRISVRLSD